MDISIFFVRRMSVETSYTYRSLVTMLKIGVVAKVETELFSILQWRFPLSFVHYRWLNLEKAHVSRNFNSSHNLWIRCFPIREIRFTIFRQGSIKTI